MRILSIAALLICVSACSATWLYTADVAIQSATDKHVRLYAYNTATQRTTVVGFVEDSDGTPYPLAAMHYLPSTGLIYALVSQWPGNSTIAGRIVAINPQTAKGSLARKIFLRLYFTVYH